MTGTESWNFLSRTAQCIVFNYKAPTVQRMLDFDFIVGRPTPSIAGLVKPAAQGSEKVFMGSKEVLMRVYASLEDACHASPQATMVFNMASARSAYATTLEALQHPTIRAVLIVAEGVPEKDVRRLIAHAREMGKVIVGPASVGAIQGGAMRLGDCGGTIENIIRCGLHRPGSVALTSKSGGMSNELYNVVSRHTDGIFEGVAIGGDTFACLTLSDTVRRFQQMPQVKMIVVLGELGGVDEIEICEMIKSGVIAKPVCAWVTGTCAAVFTSDVQFGHAGAKSGSAETSAQAKNDALRRAGAYVPESFSGFAKVIADTFRKFVCDDPSKYRTPNGGWLAPLGYPDEATLSERLFEIHSRKATNIISTISDDRGDEPKYCGIPVSALVEGGEGSLGQVIALLWFRRQFPAWATRFLELCMILTADHGPCVSGAHNAIVASRAGKDVVSAVCSGLLTIGPRFGGAIDDAGRTWLRFFSKGASAMEVVEEMKRAGTPIPGIGHRVKSIHNPDRRVSLLVDYARQHFPAQTYLNYALGVEAITTQKGPNLILNVDGCMAAMFLDMFEACITPRADMEELVAVGSLNGIFVLARTIGLIGHVYDQKRLKQSLYRHPYEDVLYAEDEGLSEALTPPPSVSFSHADPKA